jgi:hypothetical protein
MHEARRLFQECRADPKMAVDDNLFVAYMKACKTCGEEFLPEAMQAGEDALK